MTLLELIQLPEHRGTSRKDWSKRLGLSNSYLSEILNGRKTPSISVIRQIAEKTDGAVPPAAWFEGLGE